MRPVFSEAVLGPEAEAVLACQRPQPNSGRTPKPPSVVFSRCPVYVPNWTTTTLPPESGLFSEASVCSFGVPPIALHNPHSLPRDTGDIMALLQRGGVRPLWTMQRSPPYCFLLLQSGQSMPGGQTRLGPACPFKRAAHLSFLPSQVVSLLWPRLSSGTGQGAPTLPGSGVGDGCQRGAAP